MKKVTWVGSICVAMVLAIFGASRASADSTLELVGVGGASSGGFYIYPYDISVTTGGSTVVNPMMCLDFYDEISIGSTWQATEHSASSLGAPFEEAAFLYQYGLTHPSDLADAQWAAWDLFDTGVAAAGGTNDAEEIALLAEARGLTPAELADYGWYMIWVPDGANFNNGQYGMGGLGGQFFFDTPEPTPEPASLFLLGSGILGLALFLYFRKRKSGHPLLSAE